MESNTYYYTLSTISQTLAGAFGFIMAVVLFRLQAITADIQSRLPIAKEGRHPSGSADSETIAKAESERDWRGLAEYLEGFPPRPGSKYPEHEIRLQTRIIKKNGDRIESIKTQLKRSLWPTGLTTAISLILLAFADYIVSHHWAVWLVRVVAVASLICLGTYLPLVWDVIETGQRPTDGHAPADGSGQ